MPPPLPKSNPILPFISHAPQETHTLGVRLGRCATAGMVLALSGDLGSGKTVFAQGLAQGLDVPGRYYITSPSYTLINAYPGRHPFFHMDLYRIDRLSDLEEIGLYEILDGDGVVAIEWAEKMGHAMPPNHLAIHFEIIDQDSRRIRITACGTHAIEFINRLKQTYKEY